MKKVERALRVRNKKVKANRTIYTWREINLALMGLGYSPARIWDVLSKLTKVKASEKFLAIISTGTKKEIEAIYKGR